MNLTIDKDLVKVRSDCSQSTGDADSAPNLPEVQIAISKRKRLAAEWPLSACRDTTVRLKRKSGLRIWPTVRLVMSSKVT